MRYAWFNCGAGVAGDMVLAALIDAGADADAVTGALDGLAIEGWALSFERVHRGSIAATYANVTTNAAEPPPAQDPHEHHPGHEHEQAGGDHAHHTHRPVREILALLDVAELDDRVRRRAVRVFRTLGQAEGEVHDIDPADVELHEVGSIDAIVDVVGVCAALESLGIDRLACSPIAVGHGSATTAHGRLSTPAPAVGRLLAAHRMAVTGIDTDLEIATPTGVALMAALADHAGPVPAMTVERTGFGAGTANPAHRPNVVNVLVGTAPGSGPSTGTSTTMMQLETNVDDVTGEVLAHTVDALLEAGANDAWITPIVMKKGRPAHTVHVLAATDDAVALTDVLLRETGSLGVRTMPLERTALDRDDLLVDVDGHPIRVKRAVGRWKPEFDDVRAAAVSVGRPLRDVLAEATQRAVAGELRSSEPRG